MKSEDFDWPTCLTGTHFEGKDFVTNKLSRWTPLFSEFRDRDASVLEIGSFEGRSALFFLSFLPSSTITCIDPLHGERNKRFDHNLRRFEGRVNKMRDFSLSGLMELRQKERRFDIIYIDGNHERETVLLDSVLSWPMLNVGGILLWDDYSRYKRKAPAWKRPKTAVDGFLVAFANEWSELDRGRQLAVRKTVESPYPKIGMRPKGGRLVRWIRRRTLRLVRR